MSSSPRVKVTSYPKKFIAGMEEEFAKRTKRAAEVIAQDLRKNLSTVGGGNPSKPDGFPHMQSGALMRGVRVRVSKRAPYTCRVENRSGHNDPLEFGTAGGKIIAPKTGKALRFHKGGKAVFVKWVKQGAIKPRAQARRTLEAGREKIRAIYTRGIPELKGGGNKAIVRIG